MANEIKISRVTALPDPIEPSMIYIVQAADAALAEVVFTSTDGAQQRRILNKADVQAMITAAIAAGGGGGGGGNADSATKLLNARLINGVAFDGTQDITVPAVDTATPRIPMSQKGAPNGVATLGADGLIPANQLPSFVDDILDVADAASLPPVGEASKIYVTLDDNTIYRWTGSQYVAIRATAGNADTATKLIQARNIAMTGDVAWSVNFDGSQNVTAAATLSNTGVGAGEYPVVTVNAKGRVTAGRALAAGDIPTLDYNKVISAQSLHLVDNQW